MATRHQHSSAMIAIFSALHCWKHQLFTYVLSGLHLDLYIEWIAEPSVLFFKKFCVPKGAGALYGPYRAPLVANCTIYRYALSGWLRNNMNITWTFCLLLDNILLQHKSTWYKQIHKSSMHIRSYRMRCLPIVVFVVVPLLLLSIWYDDFLVTWCFQICIDKYPLLYPIS
jgi:hypothetical protein